MAVTYLKNRTPHKALKMETPFKMLHGEKADLSHIRVIGARTFVNTKSSKKLDAAAWEGKVCGYSEGSKTYRVWNSKTHHVVESRKFTFIETPPHLLPPPSEFSPLQDLVPPSWDLDDDILDNDYISYDDLLWDIRDYTGVLDFTTNIPANRENANGVSADPQVQELVDEIRHLTRRDFLTPGALWPGAASPAEPLPGAVREPLSRGTSPPSRGEASPKTGELSPAPMPVTARRGTAMRNNIIPWLNVVTWRAATEPRGVVARYRVVRPNNNNNNNHATPAKLF